MNKERNIAIATAFTKAAALGLMSAEQYLKLAAIMIGGRVLVFGSGHDIPLWDLLSSRLKVIEDDPAYAKYDKIALVSYTTNRDEPNEEPSAPEECLADVWDLVIVDGPKGYASSHPGRESSIYAASIHRERGATVAVHDYERKWERYHCDRFLGAPSYLVDNLAIWESIEIGSKEL